MSTTTFAILISGVILLQVAGFAAFGFYRQQARYRALERPEPNVVPPPSAVGSTVPAITRAIAWSGEREFVVQRRVIEDGNASVCSFYLVPTDGAPLPVYQPGQYLTFKLEIPEPTGGLPTHVVRCYSLSDRPRTDHFRVSIKRVPAPPGKPDVAPGIASNHFHDHIQEGSRLSVRAPSGHFHLDAESELPIVLIAGGIGLTPLLSILNTLAHEADPREVWLFYGVRHRGEHIMKAHLEHLRDTHPTLHLHVCYAEPSAEDRAGIDYQHQGWIDIQLLRRTLHFGRYDFYVCGPLAMMETLVPALGEAGVADENIHYESFGPASLTRRRAPVSATVSIPVAVRFSRSGKTIQWDSTSDSLLELAEDQGIRVDSGCRAGSCGSCQTRIESGEVVYQQTPDADVKPGHCLLCIATPATDLTLAL
ncbi:2Fe-2S iron-sulfur cluster-binding protein [Allochromatium palmeri]|uniref:nitric oxide dioxygenase n=1 Tax=Allochromatium palmeri TaxID=231048 RepID=A0A6N8E747_9GAMM|nr:2Fe-2S iron-sulfur cluster-binding protein [Allochromatium palmeri]MTW20053.1 2Fe-2S iron-sulfur cluster binding domain-containing protein [Allochromatium palmeri]